MKKFLVMWIAAMFSSALLCAAPENEAALAAGREWLDIVDKGDYAASYDASAAVVKSALTKDQWVQQIRQARGMFGEVLARNVQSSRFTKDLPGAPDGEYVVIQFAAAFENKSAAVETLTVQKTPDGKWRMSGYFIR